MDIWNESKGKLVTSVEFANAPYSSNLIHLHGCCSFFNVVRVKRMMRTWDFLDSVDNNHIIIVFVEMTVSMELNPRMKVTLYKAK